MIVMKALETMRDFVLVAHPDDAECIFGYHLQAQAGAAHVMVVTDGDSGIDRTGNCLCRTW